MYSVLGVRIAEFLLSKNFQVQFSSDFPFDTYSDSKGHIICIDNCCEKGLSGITYGGQYGEEFEAFSLEEIENYLKKEQS